MPCTTILVGRKATNNGSTIIARTDDGFFDEKKLIVTPPKKQPKTYKSVISHLEVELPDQPMRYTCSPSVDPKNGIWAACGINEVNVGMTATETITSNPRVLGADPYVIYQKAKSRKEKDIPGGLGEEDYVVLVLPYIHSAREGVIRLGELLEKYGTYEPNGIAFNDQNEVWWMETIGGHHWIAKKVRDDSYVVMPNQFGLDHFDLKDAMTEKKENMCSSDLEDFIKKNHLNLNQGKTFNPRYIFGSRTDADHVYNTPRAWYMGRYFNPHTYRWDGENADFTPESDDIPWSFVPEKKITVEDVKYILSSYYQGTPYNLYSKADRPEKGIYRPIGISRTGMTGILEIRGNMPKQLQGIEWICFGANAFNAALPVYANTDEMPKYLSDVKMDVSTDNFYWGSRLIGALADSQYGACIQIIERYQNAVAVKGRAILHEYDAKMIEQNDYSCIKEANQKLAEMARKETTETLNQILKIVSQHMKNGYSRADN